MPLIKASIIFFFLLLISSFFSHAETVIYQYDDLNRLIRVEQPDGSAIDYDYDEVGNRIRKEVTPRTSCPGDANGDSDIDADDLSVLIIDLNNGCAGDCQGDVDGNGVVNESDISLFTEYFGRVDCE
jgi:YD repeat-containing protein